ncbi:MAG: hypothetical protein Q8P57_00025 [Candidatus Pacearchaeota archaeon]|nr:hypothetical protein [Candidatus Pacearchaeota archaeon]
MQLQNKIFKNKRYIVLSLSVAILFYLLNAVISDIFSIKSFYSNYKFLFALKLTYLDILGFHNRILTHSFVSLIIISILFGILVSLLTYKTSKNLSERKNKSGFIASAGIFLGVLAPGCITCGVGLASLLGLGAFLTFLPYEGLELSLLSIILLLFANYKVSKTLLNNNSCKIKQKPLNLKKLKGGK